MSIRAVKNLFGHQHLSVAHHTQLKTKIQLVGECLQEFATIIKQLPHSALPAFHAQPQDHVRKEALVELTLAQSPIRIWVFVTEITGKFIPGLYVLHTHDAFVDLVCHMLQLGQEEVLLWRPQAQPKSSSIVVPSDRVTQA
jgi:hypothetical protein